MAAMRASTSASTKNCPTIRPRLEPRANRIAISCSRVAVRANTIVATLDASTSSSSTKMNCTSWMLESASFSNAVYCTTRGLRCSCVAGKSAAVRNPIAAISALASSSVTLGARRPKIWIAGPSRRWNESALARNGTQNS